MTEGIQHEGLLIGCRKAKEGGWVVTIRTHADDQPGLETLPLNSRLGLVIALLKDEE